MKDQWNKKIHASVAAGDFATALQDYVDCFLTYENRAAVVADWSVTHRRNAGSLARKYFYDLLIESAQALPRCRAALEHFVGVKRYEFSNPQQRPNFLYVPGLPAKPFYNATEIDGIHDIVQHKQAIKSLYLNKRLCGQNSYIDHIGTVPKSEAWDSLRDSWQSLHFYSAGKKTDAIREIPENILASFESRCVPHCPPFSPEVFISVLQPDAYIPPHYGISNVKLTAHIPIKVTPNAWLKAGGEVFNWHNEDVMIFDDSFQHSAKNADSDDRVVLIFDVWHPDLNQQEKSFFRRFMALHSEWAPSMGLLANLDK